MLSDLLQPGVGSGDRVGRSGAPSLADYYRHGLPVQIEPGTRWVYSNHGFAALGQIVEDVTGQPLDRYLREHLFDPLGMARTDLVRSERVRPHQATGYVLRSRGLKPVADREVPTVAGSGAYSAAGDLARYVAALCAEARASTARAETGHPGVDVRTALPARSPAAGDGSGVRAHAIAMAPAEGIGVVVLGNTGSLDGRGAPEPLAARLLRRLIDLPGVAIRTDLPPRPETWSELCGWYGLDSGPVTNLFTRAIMGAGAEVRVRDGHLVLTPLTPIPAMRRDLRLYPDDTDDPRVFRVEFPGYGMQLRVVFSRGRLLLDVAMALRKRPDVGNPRRWALGLPVAGAVALAVRRSRHGRPS